MDNLSEPGHLRDYLRPLWSHKVLIVLLVLASTAAVYVYESRKPDQFTAATQVFVQRSAVQGLLGTGDVGSDRNVANLATLARSSDVAEIAALRLGRDDSGAIQQSMIISNTNGSDFILFQSTQGDRQQAADVANAYAQAYIDQRGRLFRRQVRQTIESAEEQLRALSLSDENSAERRGLQDNIRRLQILVGQPDAGGDQQDRAIAPAERSSPQPIRSALFAFALSLLVALGLAYGLERLDRRIKRIEDVAPAYGRPLLTALPRTGATTEMSEGQAALSQPFKEGFRALRTGLQLAALDRPIRKLLVTSALPGEGKSTVVRNLAIAYRESGYRVVVVDSDLRRPRLDELFALEGTAGFTDVLTGQRTLADALQPVDVETPGLETLTTVQAAAAGTAANGSGNGAYPAIDTGSLMVLTSGAVPPNPGAVLAAKRAHALLDELANDFDVVIIDSAPLLAVTDSVTLLREVDGVVLVARLGKTTKDAARRLMELIGRVPDTNVVGVVANDITAIESSPEYSYGYHYGYGK